MPEPPAPVSTRALRRLAVVQMPTLDCAAAVFVGLAPPREMSVIGTWIAMLCTLRFWVVLTPGAADSAGRPKVACKLAMGRRLSLIHI